VNMEILKRPLRNHVGDRDTHEHAPFDHAGIDCKRRVRGPASGDGYRSRDGVYLVAIWWLECMYLRISCVGVGRGLEKLWYVLITFIHFPSCDYLSSTSNNGDLS